MRLQRHWTDPELKALRNWSLATCIATTHGKLCLRSPLTYRYVFQSAGELSTYFSGDLVRLLSAARDCRVRTKEMCRLDFDPIYSSQDPSILYDLKVTRRTDAQVRAEFKNVVARPPIRLDFKMVLTLDGWRIDDVRYENGHTLRAILEGEE